MGIIQYLSDPTLFIFLSMSLIFSLTFHEYAHGIVAYYYGDDTAYRNGRLTLNPLAHLDPMGTIMILFIGIGYAKPVPVNPHNLSNPRNDIIKVAAAGPISNIILSFISFFIFYLIQPDNNSNLFILLYLLININISLAIFNLLPVYPLDGGQIFGNLIAKHNPQIAQKLLIYGPKVLLAVILIGLVSGFSIIWIIIEPIRAIILLLFQKLITLIMYLFSFIF